MKNLVEIDPGKCRLSYSCVRICPVKAIEVKPDEEFPRILPERCIGCGSCIQACGQQAIGFRHAIPSVRALLSSKAKVAIMLSPEIAAEFGDVTDYRKFVTMIKQLGFDFVVEVAFGVDLVAKKYSSLFSEFKGKYYITSCCPAIVSFVQKFHPSVTGNLAPIVSPMEAMAKVVRSRYGSEVSVVYLGPCVEAKAEAEKTTGDGRVNAVLTFLEIRMMFREYNISETSLEYSDFDPPFGNLGGLYPFSEGLLYAAGLPVKLPESRIYTSEGRDNSIEALNAFENLHEQIRHHFNLFYCEGCMSGPGMSKKVSKFARKSWVVDYVEKRTAQLDHAQWEKDMETYSGLNLSRNFEPDDRRLPFPPEEKIREVLKLLGKPMQEEEPGCGTCGYANCRDFAVAVAQGLAKTEMCLSFSLKNRQDYIKTLKQTNEKLARTQEALKNSERIARKEQQLANEAMDTIHAMLHKLPSGVVIVDDKLRIVQSNSKFVAILGKEAEEISEVVPGLKGADLKSLIPYPFYNLFSYVLEKDEEVVNRDVPFGDTMLTVSVFTIRKNRIAGAIVRDIHMPEVAHEEVIRRVGEAIGENLELVQKIAFLLGEGASKTERILNSIIEFQRSDKK